MQILWLITPLEEIVNVPLLTVSDGLILVGVIT